MMSELSIIRHGSVFDAVQHNNTPIHIIGCGATGSRVFMALIELGLTNITCYDPDIVEAHNLANQAFLNRHIDLPKVGGLSGLYCDKMGVPTYPEDMHFKQVALPSEGVELEGVVFLLTDSMSSRREIYDACIKDNPMVVCMIETRMASVHGNSYLVRTDNPESCEVWVNSLISDDDAEVSPCGSPISIGPTASIIANLAVWQYMAFMIDDGTLTESVDIYLKPIFTSTKDSLHE